MHRTRNFFFLLVLATILSGCIATRFNLQEGIRSFQVQNYRQAFIRLKPEAAKYPKVGFGFAEKPLKRVGCKNGTNLQI